MFGLPAVKRRIPNTEFGGGGQGNTLPPQQAESFLNIQCWLSMKEAQCGPDTLHCLFVAAGSQFWTVLMCQHFAIILKFHGSVWVSLERCSPPGETQIKHQGENICLRTQAVCCFQWTAGFSDVLTSWQISPVVAAVSARVGKRTQNRVFKSRWVQKDVKQPCVTHFDYLNQPTLSTKTGDASAQGLWKDRPTPQSFYCFDSFQLKQPKTVVRKLPFNPSQSNKPQQSVGSTSLPVQWELRK